MSNVRWERMAAASGVVFVPLFIGAGILIGSAGGELVENIDPAIVAQRLADNTGQLFAGATLAGLAAAALLWFAGSLRAILRPGEGTAGRLSAVAFGGGVLGAALIVTAAILSAAAAFDLADHLGLDEAATAVYSLGGGMAFFGTAFALGLLATAASLVMVRTGTFPKWLGIWGLITGIVLVLGWATFFATFIAGAVALLWLIATSIVAVRKVGS